MRNFFFKRGAHINYIDGGSGIINDMLHMYRTLDECELFIVTSGVLYIRQGGVDYELHTGDYLLTERNIEYGGDRPICGTFHWLHFKYAESDAFFAESEDSCGKTEGYLSFPKCGHLLDIGQIIVLCILSEQFAADETKKEIADAICYALLLDICESAAGKAVPHSKDKRFQPILEYFRTNPDYGDFHGVKEMSEYFGYNERHLLRLFKKNTGKTPHEYITEKKIVRAQEMLADTNMTVKSIARVLHFDYYYFMRLFRKYTGVSPTQFRKNVIPDWERYLPKKGE